jgi:hypothetical protein
MSRIVIVLFVLVSIILHVALASPNHANAETSVWIILD